MRANTMLLALLQGDLPVGVLDAPWVKLPIQLLLAGGSILVSLLLVAATGTLALVVVRSLRPSAIRAWWQSGPARITEMSAGAFGTSVGLKLAQKDAEDDARDRLLDAQSEQIALLTRLLLDEQERAVPAQHRTVRRVLNPAVQDAEDQPIPVHRQIARRMAIRRAIAERNAAAAAARGTRDRVKNRR